MTFNKSSCSDAGPDMPRSAQCGSGRLFDAGRGGYTQLTCHRPTYRGTPVVEENLGIKPVNAWINDPFGYFSGTSLP
ncbi:hypothetical protein DPMN_003352 [Dreissena polymorpha]|uniref:Uncharacterized protein n=1 Tax=Dreissena polymorpha TaxID=45954 RepID=A0A9D4RSJ5_DREPO|nr:hypothetical protein DPMN_003352 [Dreissena polymorpha]